MCGQPSARVSELAAGQRHVDGAAPRISPKPETVANLAGSPLTFCFPACLPPSQGAPDRAHVGVRNPTNAIQESEGGGRSYEGF